jgi:hypothetical protein
MWFLKSCDCYSDSGNPFFSLNSHSTVHSDESRVLCLKMVVISYIKILKRLENAYLNQNDQTAVLFSIVVLLLAINKVFLSFRTANRHCNRTRQKAMPFIFVCERKYNLEKKVICVTSHMSCSECITCVLWTMTIVN